MNHPNGAPNMKTSPMEKSVDISQTDEVLADEAFEEEKKKLAGVVLYIRNKRASLDARAVNGAAADEYAASEVRRVLNKLSDTLWEAVDQPYFGRLDYYHTNEGAAPPSGESGNGESGNGELGPKRVIYLGGSHIPDQGVFNWTAPVGKLWYTQSYEDGYTAPKGFIATRVDLKRHLRIRDGALEDVSDIFRRRLPAPDAVLTDAQDVLTDALSGVGADDGHLTVIIETIEPDQYESIANVSDKVLIVQGAAGSGKSEIGLHRIAFLLSPFTDIPESERPTPSTTLLVGPSQAFLDNVDDVLPNLGVAEGVERVRFSEWLGARMSADVSIKPRIWNDLLNNGEARRFDEGAERFKGSLAMADAMDRRASELAREIRKRCESLPPLLGPDGSERVSREQVMDALDAALPKRGDKSFPNKRRDEFVRRIREIVERDSPAARRLNRRRPATQTRAADAERRERNDLERIRTAIRGAVNEWCDEAWRRADFRREYAALLSDAGEMARLSANRLSADEARALAESVAKNGEAGGNEFGDSDAGALAYLDHLLNGTVERKYRHIVVDEAQDISPIEFRLLAESSGNNWFTILGDTAQRLAPYRGVRSWKQDLNPVFGRDDIEVQRARKSYRSTRRITEFANRILRTFDRNGRYPPIPYDRDGARVEYSRHANADAMYQAALEDIGRVRAMDGLADATVAVLARDARNLNRFRDFSAARDFADIAPLESAAAARARAVFARVPDAKGLEFDAVIIIGANESFADTLFNKKLLYLAATRAKHYLGVHWFGRQSPILAAISERGVGWVRR